MTAFVTGGTGFLGRQVVRNLVESGMRVRCLMRATSDVCELKACLGDGLWPQVEIIRGELLRPETYKAELRDVDTVVHLAAGMTGSAAALVFNNVVLTRALAEACVEAGVPRFVLVSSLGVYGAQHLATGAILDETCPVDQVPHSRDPYSYSKILQENACREIARDSGLPLIVVRPGVVFGPGRGANSTRVGLTVAGRTWRIGSKRQLPYTYVDNCAAAICRCCTAPNVIGETFNILDDDLPTVTSVLSAYRRCGRKLRSVWLPQWSIGPLSGLYECYHKFSKGQLPGIITRHRTDTFWKPLKFSNAKAKASMAWQPHVPMAEALERAIRAPLAGSS